MLPGDVETSLHAFGAWQFGDALISSGNLGSSDTKGMLTPRRRTVAIALVIALIAAGFVIQMLPHASTARPPALTDNRPTTKRFLDSFGSATASQKAPHGEAHTGADTNDPRITRFRELNACERYARHQDFVRDLKSDPYSWLNHDQTRNLMSADDLRNAEATLAFVEKNTQRCEPVPARTIDSIIALYQSALAAARAGDRMAARCFVIAPWPTSISDDAPHQQLQALYLTNVDALVAAGIEAGDMDMVRLAGSIRATHGHGLAAIGLPYDARKAYGYHQLQGLFARGPEIDAVKPGVDRLAQELRPDEMAAEIAWAKATYAKSFASRPYAPPSLACDR